MSENRNYTEDLCIGYSELGWARDDIERGRPDRAVAKLQGIVRAIGRVGSDECFFVWQIARLAEKALLLLSAGQGGTAAREIGELLDERKDTVALANHQYRLGHGMEVGDE